MLTMYTVYKTGSIFLRLISYAILAYCVLSWFRPQNRFFYALAKFVMPFVRPFRRLSMWITAKTKVPLDFSCWFALVGVSVIQSIWTRICFALM